MVCICLQVISSYIKEGFDFLLKAFNSPNFLEDLTGLSQLYAETDDAQVCTCVDSVKLRAVCRTFAGWSDHTE